VTFEFATATRIVVGPGSVAGAASIVGGLGRRALLVTGRAPGRATALAEALSSAGIAHVRMVAPGEPTVDLVRDGIELARAERCDTVVGFGGGSVLDTAKAIAAMLGNGGDLLDHLEVIGGGVPLAGPSVPWVAIPTTAGTGSEVTRNAVLASPEHRVKVSLRSPHMLARVAIVDPELTYDLPSAPTASSGLDALTQLVEPFTSSRANPMTDAICREGMARAARSLRRAFDSAGRAGASAAWDGPSGRAEESADAGAREDMSLAALFGGMALANAGLGAAHGFAAPIGGAFPAPHGATCGRLLPVVVSVNVRALRRREPDSAVLLRYDEVARILTGRPGATATDAVAWLEQLVEDLGIPRLAAYGIRAGDIPDLVERAAVASSMHANPVRLAPDELEEILARAL
jgi:alcohol dehydrogenase class IV